MKKGQVSVLIIVAVLVVAGFVAYILVKPDSSSESIPEGFEGIHGFINGCVEESARESVYFVAQTGGYYDIPELSTNTEIAYYYDGIRNRVPLLADVERQMGLAFENIFLDCVGDYASFDDINVDDGKIGAMVDVSGDLVSFNVDYPVSFSKGVNVAEFSKFSAETPVRLELIHSVSDEIADSLKSSNGAVCINCFFDLSDENDLYIEMYDHELDASIFVVRDKTFKLNGDDFAWYFAAKNF